MNSATSALHNDSDRELLGEFVAEVLTVASAGRVEKQAVVAAARSVGLPAHLYVAGLDQIQAEGFQIVIDEDEPPIATDHDTGGTLDGMGYFMKKVAHPVLSMGEEQALGARMDAGRLAARALEELDPADPLIRRSLRRRVADGKSASEELARHNIRLVVHTAFKLRRRCTVGIEVEDLIQEGYFGLARAIEGWDPTRLLKFSTYATWWIRQSMERALANQVSTIRLPVHVRDDLRKLLRCERELVATGRPINVGSLARLTGFSPTKIRELRQASRGVDSLDRTLFDGATKVSWSVADGADGPEEAVERVFRREMVAQALSALTEREQQIVCRRYGLEDGRVWTLEEVGAEFGVTRERIRQIEAKTLAKLRHPLRSAGLRGLLD